MKEIRGLVSLNSCCISS